MTSIFMLRSNRFLMVGLASLAVTVHGTALAEKSGPWGAIAKLRDDTNMFPTGKPAGGWYVAPIHATLRASDGNVLITGFGRKGESNCTGGRGGDQREHGETFVFSPADIDAKSKKSRRILCCDRSRYPVVSVTRERLAFKTSTIRVLNEP